MAAIAVSPTARATNLVTNGDFTSLSNGLGQIDNLTTATGWVSSGYNFVMTTADQAVDSQYGAGNLALWDLANGGNNTWDGKAAGAGNFLALDGAYMTGPVTQSISGLQIGQTYDLTFNYAFAQQHGFDQDTVQHLTATIDGISWQSADFALPEHGFTGWQSETLQFTASAATATLSFLAYGNKPVPPFALVSNVSLPSAVPEPATWAMMIIGVGGIGALARRRRAAGVTAITAAA